MVSPYSSVQGAYLARDSCRRLRQTRLWVSRNSINWISLTMLRSMSFMLSAESSERYNCVLLGKTILKYCRNENYCEHFLIHFFKCHTKVSKAKNVLAIGSVLHFILAKTDVSLNNNTIIV